MAARARYPTPHAQLLELATDAKLRGEEFEDFWERAVRPGVSPVSYRTPEADRPRGVIIWPADTTDRNLARRATDEAKEGWRRAYDGVSPTREEQALRILAPILSELERRGLGSRDALPSAA